MDTLQQHQVYQAQPGSTIEQIVWLDNNTLAYTETSYTSDQIPREVMSYLYTSNLDGTNKKMIDSSKLISIIGKMKATTID